MDLCRGGHPQRVNSGAPPFRRPVRCQRRTPALNNIESFARFRPQAGIRKLSKGPQRTPASPRKRLATRLHLRTQHFWLRCGVLLLMGPLPVWPPAADDQRRSATSLPPPPTLRQRCADILRHLLWRHQSKDFVNTPCPSNT